MSEQIMQVAVDEALGQTSDQQILVEQVRGDVKAHLKNRNSFSYGAPSFDEFFVPDDYYYVLQLWLGVVDTTRGLNLYRRVIYSEDICFIVDIEVMSKNIVLRDRFAKLAFSFSPEEFYSYGYKYIRDCVLKSAGLFMEDEHVFPIGVADLFPRACIKIQEDLKNIQSNSLDLVVRLGDLRIFHDSVSKYGYKDIYDFCKHTFGLAKTTVKYMLEIYDKFFEKCRLKTDFSDYSYSQLVELCAVDSKDLGEFDASMSVRDMRRKKKELSAAAEPSVPSVDKFTSGQPEDGAIAGGSSEGETVADVAKEDVASIAPILDYQAAIDAVKAMENPYYVPGKDKQSARYDAYAKALSDVLAKLDAVLVENLQSATEA